MKNPILATHYLKIGEYIYRDGGDKPVGKDEYSMIKFKLEPMPMKIDQSCDFFGEVWDYDGKKGYEVGKFDHRFYFGLEDLDSKYLDKYNRLILNCNSNLCDKLKSNNDFGVIIKINDVYVNGEPFYKWLKKHPYQAAK